MRVIVREAVQGLLLKEIFMTVDRLNEILMSLQDNSCNPKRCLQNIKANICVFICRHNDYFLRVDGSYIKQVSQLMP